ncbi:PLP-dependent lyase/thiolase [Hymenobacter cheonanensis]|uniref:PLP-dependent lyase/thiolase n=1 Tax=Hymenobacter sp. CA2-7 TaxID=3063993 RepID=UPI0027136C5D|nr:PLP-dependent lyase/thiolase [Hymenobacter sp. CA2-7]MDO7886651.1 PLP-dependent lyase/thiolase [Hymenobacter sp. CA2-7]
MTPAAVVPPTPLLSLAATRPGLWLKLETTSPAGSIKARGVAQVLADSPAPIGLTTYSTGNHGIAVAVAAQRLGVPCRVFCPPTLAAYKQQLLLAHGATLVASSLNADAGQAAAAREAATLGWLFVPLANHAGLLAGYATVVDEIAHQLGPAFRLVVPVGTGSLLRACTERVAELGISARLVGAEPTAYSRFNQTAPLAFSSPSLADGLAINHISPSNQPALQAATRVAVTEAAIAEAMRLTAAATRLQLEGAAAVAVAAAWQLPTSPEPVVALATGGNIGAAHFTGAIANFSYPATHHEPGENY